MALINALRSSFSSKQNWGNSIYALSILFLLSLAGNQLCQHKAIESTFSNTHNSQFSCSISPTTPTLLSLFLALKKPKPQRILPSQPNFVACLTQLADYSPVLLGREQGNMSCTIATCMEPENWVKILFYFPLHCPFSFSSQQFSVHIHKLFFMTRKSFSRCLFN